MSKVDEMRKQREDAARQRESGQKPTAAERRKAAEDALAEAMKPKEPKPEKKSKWPKRKVNGKKATP